MIKIPREMALLNQVANALEEVQSIPEILDIRDKAEALRSQGKKFDLSREIVVMASAIKVKAERKLGEILAELTFNRGGRPKSNGTPPHGSTSPKENRLHHDTGLRLADFDISRSVSSRSQLLAKLPRKDFNEYVHTSVEASREPTTAGALRLAKRHVAKKRAKKRPRCEGYVTSLATLKKKRQKFATIYADPPWPYRNRTSNGAAENHYSTMTMEDILAEPVAELTADHAHLHLWVAAGFLQEGLEVMQAWGFCYKSYFVWVKPHIGTGNYYRMATEIMMIGEKSIGQDHEMLLFGNRGGEPFLENGVRSWAEYPRRAHSEKPEEVRAMIEKVSPGPYLEMYSRKKPQPGWTAYGNQISRS